MQAYPLRFMAILAHPDDESLAIGGVLARYAAEGVDTALVCATRGERGWFFEPADYPGPEALGVLRTHELYEAASALGIREVHFLNYIDGELDQADHSEALEQIVTHLRRFRPQVVVTFDPTGFYGHPDHIAISQLATAAITAAADPTYARSAGLAHRVAKLYYVMPTTQLIEAYQAAFGDLVMTIDGVERRAVGWNDWAITTRIDTRAYAQQVWQAIACHRTQLPGYDKLLNLSEEYHAQLWGTQTFYRAMSLVNGGRTVEDDMFAGLREPTTLEVGADRSLELPQRRIPTPLVTRQDQG